MPKNLPHKYYDEISLGIDFTARDIQRECKEKGLPWEKAKAFDGSALISRTFIDKSELDVNKLNFSLKKNEEIVQNGNTSDMLFNVDQVTSMRFARMNIPRRSRSPLAK